MSWRNARRLPPPLGFPQLRGAKLPEPTAQSIHFLQEQDSLVVSYLHHGIMLGFLRYPSYSGVTPFTDAGTGILYLSSGKSHRGRIKCLFQPRSHTSLPNPFPSGRSCLSVDRKAIAVTNLFDGVDWYDLTSRGLVDSLRTTIEDNVIIPIVSDGAGSLIIGGSCGTVQLLQPFPAIVIQTLELEGEWRR